MNMDYNLALELKNAGFPMPTPKEVIEQGLSVKYIFDPNDHHMVQEQRKVAYVPNLSELIEACGDETVIVKYYTSRISMGRISMRKRMANAECKGICEIGSTPEEAVAKLWLAINVKNS